MSEQDSAFDTFAEKNIGRFVQQMLFLSLAYRGSSVLLLGVSLAGIIAQRRNLLAI
jgi:hypothetical protein